MICWLDWRPLRGVRGAHETPGVLTARDKGAECGIGGNSTGGVGSLCAVGFWRGQRRWWLLWIGHEIGQFWKRYLSGVRR